MRRRSLLSLVRVYVSSKNEGNGGVRFTSDGVLNSENLIEWLRNNNIFVSKAYVYFIGSVSG